MIEKYEIEEVKIKILLHALQKTPSLLGLNAKVLEQHRSTLTSVVKPLGL